MPWRLCTYMIADVRERDCHPGCRTCLRDVGKRLAQEASLSSRMIASHGSPHINHMLDVGIEVGIPEYRHEVSDSPSGIGSQPSRADTAGCRKGRP